MHYEDFYIYIVGDNSNKILEKILETKNKLFENTTSLSDDTIKEKFGFEIKDCIVKFSTKLNSEIGYILISNATPEIEEKVNNLNNTIRNYIDQSLKIEKTGNALLKKAELEFYEDNYDKAEIHYVSSHL